MKQIIANKLKKNKAQLIVFKINKKQKNKKQETIILINNNKIKNNIINLNKKIIIQMIRIMIKKK